MESTPIFYKLLLVSLLWLCFMLHVLWPDTRAAMRPTPPTLPPPPRKRPKAPKPFAGLLHQPLCTACAQATNSRPKTPGAPPPLITYTRGRQRTVDTQEPFCPDPDCSYAGGMGRGNIRANGLPTICQAEFVTFFAPAALRAHNESGWHHNTYDDAAWPSGYAGVGRQYCVRPGHAAVPSPVTPYIPG